MEMKGITKIYDNGVLANDKVDITLHTAEIHAIAGENGAGKSTIMKILYGLERKDGGSILLEGKPVEIRSPKDAMRLGIGMVHQHFMLVNQLPVYQNIFLGHEITKRGFLNREEMVNFTQKLGEKYGMRVDSYALCSELPVGMAQKVEILKALSRGTKILILDEPTAVLTPQETQELFEQLRLLKKDGCTVVIITHKLKEILTLCDRITVMRSGKTVGEYCVEGMDEATLSRLMVGRDVQLEIQKQPQKAQEAVLTVKDLCVQGRNGKWAANHINFSVKRGEILCLAGIEGNGQREVVRSITGLNPRYTGSICLLGKDIRGWPIQRIRKTGLAHIPEDRLASGVNPEASILDNLISVDFRENSKLGLIPYKKYAARASRQLKSFHIKASSYRQKVSMLSGGNMQKVVAAREIETDPQLLVADQPTRGVDIGAMELIHQRLLALRDQSRGVLLISADLREVMGLSDRILVFHEGSIIAQITDVEHLSEEQLGRYMLGIDKMEGGDLDEA